jgi:hypothetical protein
MTPTPPKSERLYDKRIVARNIKRQRVSKKEVEDFVKSLEDVTSKAEPIFDEEKGSARAEK